MRIVLDTNVLISGIFFGGIPGRILSAWASGKLTLVLSPDILDEYRRVGQELTKRYPDIEVALESVLTLLAMNATIVDALPLDAAVSKDPDDDKFLACALASRTSIIVSGDNHLRSVSDWQGIEVLTPRQFHDRHLKERAH